MQSLMVWSIQRLYNGSQYINQDVDKVKHPTYCQVPLVCITTYPKIHSVMASPFPKKMQRAGCFLSIWSMTAQTAYRGQSNEFSSQIMPLTLTFTQLPHTFVQLPWALHFRPGLQNELVKRLLNTLFWPPAVVRSAPKQPLCLWRNLTPLRSLLCGKRPFPKPTKVNQTLVPFYL